MQFHGFLTLAWLQNQFGLEPPQSNRFTGLLPYLPQENRHCTKLAFLQNSKIHTKWCSTGIAAPFLAGLGSSIPKGTRVLAFQRTLGLNLLEGEKRRMFRRHLATSAEDAYNIHFYNRGNLIRCKDSLPISDFVVASLSAMVETLRCCFGGFEFSRHFGWIRF